MENRTRNTSSGSMDYNFKRTDPEYVRALIEKKPHRNDPNEIVIVNKIKAEVLKSEFGQNAFQKIGSLQKNYLGEMIASLNDPARIHIRTQEILREISQILRSQIVEGQEYLDQLPKGKPLLVATNHFGAYKLFPVDPQKELGVNISGYDMIYPFPMYFAALYPVAERLEDNLYYVSDDFPLAFGDIHRAAGFINVPPKEIVENGRTELLRRQTASLIQNHQNAAIVNYPEGGTSGKYSGLGPYDLDPFRTGCYVIAANLGIPIIHIAQYFDSTEGFKLRVFEPFIPEVTDKEGYQKYAQQGRAEMQTWLDQKNQTTKQ